MNERNSFVLYLDYCNHIERLTLKQRGILLTAIFSHVQGDEKPLMDAVTSMAFSFISSQLDRDKEKWEETRRVRAEAGKKGGAVSGQKRKQTKQMLNLLETSKQKEANEAVNVTVTDTVTVNVTDIVNETVTVTEKENNADKPPSHSNSSRFIPPTVDEVKAYCVERGNKIDPQYFVDFYASKGWKIGKEKMKDWKASVRTWEKRNEEQRKTNSRDAIKTDADYESEDDFFAGFD